MNYIFFAKHIFVFHVSSLNDVTSFFIKFVQTRRRRTDGSFHGEGLTSFLLDIFSAHTFSFSFLSFSLTPFSLELISFSISPPSPSFLSHTFFFLFLPSFFPLFLCFPLFLHYSFLPLTHIFFLSSYLHNSLSLSRSHFFLLSFPIPQSPSFFFFSLSYVLILTHIAQSNASCL